tara:strand:+ start:828 stop:1535 length:708 start_codon:yes stop_codon:yes gene_type:complete
MNIIIPFKFNSARCARKNVREFHDGKSLLDIAVENFQNHGHHVYLACEDSPKTLELQIKYSANHLSLNNTSDHWSEVMYDLSKAINEEFDPEELICLWQPVMPLFWLHNNIQEFISFAEYVLADRPNKNECDLQNQIKFKDVESVVPVYPFKDYLVDKNLQGVNFSPGTWHVPSQSLPDLYTITPMTVSTPSVYAKYHYSYSPKSAIWAAKGPYVDIDTEEEFKTAQILWKASIG